MNRSWIYRAVSAAVLAGGMLLLGSGSASAGVPVAGGEKPVVAQVTHNGTARPILARRDPATGPDQSAKTGTTQGLNGVTGLVTQVLPLAKGQGATFNESAEGLPGVTQAPGASATNGMQLSGSNLLSATGGLVQPVQGLTSKAKDLTGEALTIPIPLAAPGQIVPLAAMRTESGFAIGQNNDVPGGALIGQVGRLVGTASAPVTSPNGESAEALANPIGGANIGGLPLDQLTSPLTAPLTGGESSTTAAPQGPTGESASTDELNDTASGANIGGITLDQVTRPLTGQLDKTGLATEDAPAVPADQSTGLTGSDPIGAVTGLLGGIA